MGTDSSCSFKARPGKIGEPTAGTTGWVLKLAEMGSGKVGTEGLTPAHMEFFEEHGGQSNGQSRKERLPGNHHHDNR